MSNGKNAPPDVIVDFLGRIMPFRELDAEVRQEIARHVRVDFFPKGTWLLTMGESEVRYLYLIQQGGVKSFLTDDEGQTTLKDYRGEGDYVGALGIIRGTVANMNVETVEDTFCFLLPRDVFLGLIQSQPAFAQFYLKSFSEKIVSTAYTELRKHRVSRRSDEDLFLFSIKVGDIISRTLRLVSVTTSVQEAATIMMKYSVGSLLLYEGDKQSIVGIITDKDLRNKVVAAGIALSLSVKSIMTAPVTTINSQTLCFDALLKMMSEGIHHLAVEENGIILGIITSHDIMLLQGNSPYTLFRSIGEQQALPSLYSLAQKIPDVIRNLINEGAKAGNIAKMVALFNNQLLSRVLAQVESELGPPIVPYCWLLIGSEGRREQTFKTNQNNALVYSDPIDSEQQQKAEEYFFKFTKRAVDYLANCGYPLCNESIMASNSFWCQPLSVWKEYFSAWIEGGASEEQYSPVIFFDFRNGYGNQSLADELRNAVTTCAKTNPQLLALLLNDYKHGTALLSVFRDVVVGSDGTHESVFDINKQGLGPFVKFSRILCLWHGIRETNTLARLTILAKEGYVDELLCAKAVEACEIQMHLQLIHQLHQVEEGTLPDSNIAPGELSELEKKMLKDSFEVVEELTEKLFGLESQHLVN